MSAIAVVFRKETLDNLRDRRTLFFTFAFGPLFAPLMFMFMMNIVVDRAISSGDERLTIPMVGIETAPNLEAFLMARGIEADPDVAVANLDAAAAAVRRGEIPYALVLDPDFAEVFGSERPARLTVVFDRSNSRNSERVQRLQNAVRAYADRLGALRLLARGVSPTASQPMILDTYDVSTPTGRSALVLGVLTYFLLFSTLMGGMHLAIDATAGERERKSLEPLLTTPVSRTSLLLGKVAATSVFMVAALALTLVGFSIVLKRLPLDELGMSSGFNASTAVSALLLLAPFALLGAFLLTTVASFTRSYKEAQTWLGLVLLVPTLPVALASIMQVQLTQPLMWVPSMSQHLLITALIKQEPLEPLFVLQSVASTLIYAAVLGVIAIRLYKREALLG